MECFELQTDKRSLWGQFVPGFMFAPFGPACNGESATAAGPAAGSRASRSAESVSRLSLLLRGVAQRYPLLDSYVNNALIPGHPPKVPNHPGLLSVVPNGTGSWRDWEALT